MEFNFLWFFIQFCIHRFAELQLADSVVTELTSFRNQMHFLGAYHVISHHTLLHSVTNWCNNSKTISNFRGSFTSDIMTSEFCQLYWLYDFNFLLICSNEKLTTEKILRNSENLLKSQLFQPCRRRIPNNFFKITTFKHFCERA